MKRIAIFYGTVTGNTETVAKRINNQLFEMADLIDVAHVTIGDMDKYDFLLMGTPTYGKGGLQNDWKTFLPELKKVDMNTKTVALFGLGDSVGHPDTFVDGMGIIYQALKDSDCMIVGRCPSDEYSFVGSEALVDGEFIGLPLDQDNEPGLTDSRIAYWLSEIIPYLREII
jgi:flavodoxin, long chain